MRGGRNAEIGSPSLSQRSCSPLSFVNCTLSLTPTSPISHSKQAEGMELRRYQPRSSRALQYPRAAIQPWRTPYRLSGRARLPFLTASHESPHLAASCCEHWIHLRPMLLCQRCSITVSRTHRADFICQGLSSTKGCDDLLQRCISRMLRWYRSSRLLSRLLTFSSHCLPLHLTAYTSLACL